MFSWLCTTFSDQWLPQVSCWTGT